MSQGNPREAANVDQSKAAYAAGLFDGEGTVYLCNSNGGWQFSVSVVNTCREVIDWLQDTYDGNVYSRRPKNPTWKMKHEWYVFGREAAKFLHTISPFVIVKRNDVRIGLAYVETLRSDNKPVAPEVKATRLALLGEIRSTRRLAPAETKSSGQQIGKSAVCDSPACNEGKVAEDGRNGRPAKLA